MSEKKRDAGYRAALTGAKGTVRLLIYVCVILVIILAAKTSYQFGHDVFAEEPVASRGKGKEVTVQVRSGMEAKELGELLKDNGLIDESLLVFEVQYRLSGYYGGIKDGSYVLNTAQTVDEMPREIHKFTESCDSFSCNRLFHCLCINDCSRMLPRSCRYTGW